MAQQQRELQCASPTARFIPNKGQWNTTVEFQARAGDATIAFDRHGITLAVPVDSAGSVSFRGLRTEFVGATTTAIAGVNPTTPRFNYPEHGVSVGGYDAVQYTDAWPGIDVVYRAVGGGFKYDVVVTPGASPSQVRFRYLDAAHVERDPSGDLLIASPFGRLREHAPMCWQDIDGARVAVQAQYRVEHDGSVGYSVGAYDPCHPLIIDPCLSVEYATYLGGGGYDVVTSVATDSSRNAYACGFTRAPDFPLIPRSGRLDGRNYVFVSKLSPDGRQLVYSTTVGLPYEDLYPSASLFESIGAEIEVTANGEAIVAMSTNIDSLTTTAGAYAATITRNDTVSIDCPPLNEQNYDLYIARFTTTGSLRWGTYLGGSDDDYVVDLALDPSGRPVVAGMTYARTCGANRGAPLSFPVTAVQDGFNSGEKLRGLETFVTALTPDGRTLHFSALYGGAGNDVPGRIRFDSVGRLVMVGSTQSNNLPTTPGALQPSRRPGAAAGSADLFLARIEIDAARLEYSTYICDAGSPRRGLGSIPYTLRPTGGVMPGFERQSYRQGLVIARDGTCIIGGTTRSPDLPSTGGAFQPTLHNALAPDSASSDVFLMRIDIATQRIVQSTYLGGSQMDGFGGLALDRFGDVVVGLTTGSPDFPLSSINVQNELRGGFDAALVTLSPDLARQTYGTFIGGTRGANKDVHEQSVFGVSVDLDGALYLYGGTNSYDLPISSDALVRSNDYYGGYLIKFSAPSAPKIGATELAIVFDPNTCGDPQAHTFRLFNSGQTPMRVDSIGMKGGRYFSASTQLPTPFELAPCDTTTVTVVFNGGTVPCRKVVDDVFVVVAANAVVPRAEIPVQGRRTCVYFTVQDSTVEAEYKLGSGDRVGFPVYVYERDPTQYVTIRPAPTNKGYFTPIAGDSTPWSVGTSNIGFNVSVPDTGYYCEEFTAYVEPCGRVIPLQLCLWVRSGIFEADTAFDLGLISCRNLEIPIRVRNVGNDSLSVRVAWVGGPSWEDIFFDPPPDIVRTLGIRDTTVYPTFVQAKGYGRRESIVAFWTDQGSREGTLHYVPIRYELDSVAFNLTTAAGTTIAGFGDTVDLPVDYEPLLEGRLGIEELTVYARFDPSVLAFAGMRTLGTKMEGWTVVREQHVDSGAVFVLRVTDRGAAVKGAGLLTRLRFLVLRGDTIASGMSIQLTGVSTQCFTTRVDGERLFQLTAECAAQLRLLRQGRQPLLRLVTPIPVTDRLAIEYTVPVEGQTNITLFDVNGREIARLLDGPSPAGPGAISLDVSDVPPGLYYCRIVIGDDFSGTTPMVIVR